MAHRTRSSSESAITPSGQSLSGRTLKALRDESGLSQGQLADLAGYDRSTISAWEKGIRELREDAKLKILDALGLEAKAWHDAERFLRQMDWWRERHREPAGTELRPSRADGDGNDGFAGDIGHEIARIAEAEARDRERHVTEHLELLCRLLLEARS